jgi:hypothetical protein
MGPMGASLARVGRQGTQGPVRVPRGLVHSRRNRLRDPLIALMAACHSGTLEATKQHSTLIEMRVAQERPWRVLLAPNELRMAAAPLHPSWPLRRSLPSCMVAHQNVCIIRAHGA